MSRHEIATRRVLYEIPGMRSVHVRDAQFTGADGQPLPLQVYEAVNPVATPAPIVILLEGYPSAGFEKHIGCRFMEMEWTISMAELIAASGMTAITHSNRDPKADGLALIDHFKARGHRTGLWCVSGHGPVALDVAGQATCAVLINPVVRPGLKTLGPQDPRTPSPHVPLFIVRAGQDETPDLNTALDALIARALAQDWPITVVNYAGAPHAFDLHVDSAETRRILKQGLDFLRAHLG